MTIIWLLKRNKLDILINHFIPIIKPKDKCICTNWLQLAFNYFSLGLAKVGSKVGGRYWAQQWFRCHGCVEEGKWALLTLNDNWYWLCDNMTDPDWRSKSFIGIYFVLAIPTRFHWYLMVPFNCSVMFILFSL